MCPPDNAKPGVVPTVEAMFSVWICWQELLQGTGQVMGLSFEVSADATMGQANSHLVSISYLCFFASLVPHRRQRRCLASRMVDPRQTLRVKPY